MNFLLDLNVFNAAELPPSAPPANAGLDYFHLGVLTPVKPDGIFS
ncbi:hypothetical protein [Marinospirillum sp.]|jgi:hypothetical protein|nr:hypothetical protein [Marinospirillum sp.]